MKWMQERGRVTRTLIGGDFNARTEELGEEVGGGEEREGEEGKKSRDNKINGDGRLLVDRLEEVGWAILNEGVEGDEKENWTYMRANRQSVIDYVIGGEGEY
ncbi:stress response protein nst1-like protein [Lasius niger]|uniref:Stress response protein nst1-like protein n=1 Tax=Lasius niger TaxID=67767 RepID=A0A0J7MS45_LASNI|nr:stress response protein nst1-like protein [Lasius niger]